MFIHRFQRLPALQRRRGFSRTLLVSFNCVVKYALTLAFVVTVLARAITASRPTDALCYFSSARQSLALPKAVASTNTKGEAILDVDYESGRVIAVRIIKSSGNKKVDDGIVKTFLKWTFKPRTVTRVRVPMNVTVRDNPPPLPH